MTALCAGHPRLPPAAWDDDAPPAAHQAAARICRTCPLLLSCRVQAATDRASGVYGAALYHDGRKIAELPTPLSHGNRCLCLSCRPPREAPPTRGQVLAAAKRASGATPPDDGESPVRRRALLAADWRAPIALNGGS